jgi:hypothetical protein
MTPLTPPECIDRLDDQTGLQARLLAEIQHALVKFRDNSPGSLITALAPDDGALARAAEAAAHSLWCDLERDRQASGKAGSR